MKTDIGSSLITRIHKVDNIKLLFQTLFHHTKVQNEKIQLIKWYQQPSKPSKQWQTNMAVQCSNVQDYIYYGEQ